MRSANPHLSDFVRGDVVLVLVDDAHFGEHHRFADRARLSNRVLNRHREAVHPDLSHPVALLERDAATLIRIDDEVRQRRATGDEPTDVREIGGREFGRIHQHLPDRWDAEDDGAALAFDGAPDFMNVE